MLKILENSARICLRAYEKDNNHRPYIIELDSEEKIVYVGFTGTDQFVDWIFNLNFKKVNWSKYDSQVHAGFSWLFSIIEVSLSRDLRLLSGYKIIFCGHSLGGAMATLASSKYCHRTLSLVTFGSPRVGCAKFKKGIEKEVQLIVRVTNVLDPVGYLPLFGYSHIGKSFPLITKNLGLEAHRMEEYLAEMKEIVYLLSKKAS